MTTSKSKNGSSCITKHMLNGLQYGNIAGLHLQLLQLFIQIYSSICTLVIYVHNQPHQWNRVYIRF